MITFKEVKQELELNEQMEGNPQKAKGAELVARCFAARNAMHFFHLLTPSYSAHIAAQTFYEEIVGLTDAVAEGLIGRLGRFEAFPNVKESAIDGLQIVGNLTRWIDSNREIISEFSEIQNDIDNILTLCNSTAYRLRELK
jgi:hypothetical protein